MQDNANRADQARPDAEQARPAADQARPAIDIDNLFRYHAPKGDQTERYVTLRNKAKEFAHLIVQLTPPSAEQTLAIRQLQLATMMAIAAIAVNE